MYLYLIRKCAFTVLNVFTVVHRKVHTVSQVWGVQSLSFNYQENLLDIKYTFAQKTVHFFRGSVCYCCYISLRKVYTLREIKFHLYEETFVIR
jgi:hypothetical protein